MSLGNYLQSSQVLICNISKDVMRESKKMSLTWKRFSIGKKVKKRFPLEVFSILLQKYLLVESCHWAHFQIISQSFAWNIKKMIHLSIKFIISCLPFIWVTDVDPMQWKLFSGMKHFSDHFFLAALLASWCLPLPFSHQKCHKCNLKALLVAKFECLTFLEFGNTLYQAVVFLLTASCCRISAIVSGPFCGSELMDGVQCGCPQLHRTSSESCGWYVVPMTNEWALLNEQHKRRKLLLSFKLLVICVLSIYEP